MKRTFALWLCIAILCPDFTVAQPTELFMQFDLDRLSAGENERIDATPVGNKMANGYNTAFAFYDIMVKNTGAEDYFQSTSCWKKDNRTVNPDFKHYFDLIKPTTQVLRFPGGELGNFYHLGNLDSTGCFTDTRGYGVDEMEIISRKNPGSFAKEKKDYTRTNRNAIFDFIELCKDYPDIEVVYVINVAQHFINRYDTLKAYWLDYFASFDNWEDMLADPDFDSKMQENFNAIKLLQEHGIKIKAIEIGNELYMNDYPATLSINDSDAEIDEYVVKYANLARIYSDSLRAIFPGVPLGVPFSDRNTMFENKWNRSLRSIDSYFDAYVLHDYYTGKELYSKHAHCNEILEEKIVSMMDFMGNNQKKIWITEWNLLFGQTGNVNNTENAAFIFDYTTSIQDINTKYGDVVEMITLHNLAALSEAAPLMKARGNYFREKPAYVEPNPSVWGAYILNLFNELLSSSNKYPIFKEVYFNTVDSANLKVNRDKLFMKSFWQPDSDINGIMYFANQTNQTYSLSKENSYIKEQGRQYNFASMDSLSSAYRSQPAYSIFYIDSINGTTTFGPAFLKSDTALLPANTIGIILTTFLPGAEQAAARTTSPSCSITARDLSLEDIRSNLGDIRALLCTENIRTEEPETEAEEKIAQKEVLHTYPNPASNNIWLETGEEHADVRVYNQLGIMVYANQNASGKSNIDVSGWNAGMYHFVVNTDSGSKNGHFMVQR